MPAPLSPAAGVLLLRLVRSHGSWRVAGLPASELPAMQEQVANKLVEQYLGVYRLTAAGRAATDPPLH